MMGIQTTSKHDGKLSGAQAVSTVGGIGLLLSALLTWKGKTLPPEAVDFCQAIIPLISAMITPPFQAMLRESSSWYSNQRLERAKKRSLKVINDPNVSDHARQFAKDKYSSLCILQTEVNVAIEPPPKTKIK